MTDKVTLVDVANLENENTAIAQMAANNAAITAAMDNTLSLDGTLPNSMKASLDMDSHQIINLPQPLTLSSPLRLQDLNSFIGGGVISTIPSGGTTGQVLAKSSNSDYSVSWVNQPSPVFSFEGDSLTDITGVGTWPLSLASNFAFFNRGTKFNWGLTGDTAALMVGEYASQAGSVTIFPGQEAYFFLWAGTNDVMAGTSAATIYGYLTTLWAAARTSGYKVCAFTIMQRSDATSTENAVRLALNVLIRSNTTLYNYLVEPDLYFTNTTDSTVFLQTGTPGVHLTPAGNITLAQKVSTAILGTPPVYASPFDAMAYSGMQINGSMEISQELGTTQTTLSSSGIKYCVDGLKGFYTHGAGTAVLKQQQVAPPGSPSFGVAFTECAQLTATTALSSPAVGDRALFWQDIEGYRFSRLGFGGSAAQPFTVGFWIYATIAGTMSLSIVNAAGARSYPADVAINNATTWEYKTVTIPGDTAGTWTTGNATAVSLFFCFAAGTTFQGTPNTWNAGNFNGSSNTTNFFASSNNTVCITGIVVIPGNSVPNATRSPFIMRPFEQELILCRRYFQKSFPVLVACAQNAGVAGAVTIKNPIAAGDPSEWVKFSPSMRATPVITTYNPSATNANWRDITAGSDVTVSVDPASTLSESSLFLTTSGTVTTLGDILAIHYSANSRL